MEEALKYIKEKKEKAGSSYKASESPQPPVKALPSETKPRLAREFDEFVNHIELKSSSTTTMKILDGIEEIKDILSNQESNYGTRYNRVEEEKSPDRGKAVIYINDPTAPFSEVVGKMEDILSHLESVEIVTLRNTANPTGDVYDEELSD